RAKSRLHQGDRAGNRGRVLIPRSISGERASTPTARLSAQQDTPAGADRTGGGVVLASWRRLLVAAVAFRGDGLVLDVGVVHVGDVLWSALSVHLLLTIGDRRVRKGTGLHQLRDFGLGLGIEGPRCATGHRG